MDIKKAFINRDKNREERMYGIFASLFIFQNRLQTLFDNFDSSITLKQFMLLILIKMSKPNETFTNYGKMLGCSRQNIKKLVNLLEKNYYIELRIDDLDKRKSSIKITKKTEDFFINNSDLHLEKLDLLFKDYTDEEIKQFYAMMGKLYDGIERLEKIK
ncbi:MAG: MarR family transcriptional regulator [Miniphocaeibacter sp.]|uniref:MarR family winged helix-turn-helix transcriptional regulator n=1 Tax=Miniphocaeibacter sp. TaxID=3100973 RepID=UPI003BAE5B74